MDCHVCEQPIAATVVRVEVVERRDSGEVVWGPVPVHRSCERAVVTPFDPYLDAGYVRIWRFLDAVPREAAFGLHALET
jgi:hypothetical protein